MNYYSNGYETSTRILKMPEPEEILPTTQTPIPVTPPLENEVPGWMLAVNAANNARRAAEQEAADLRNKIAQQTPAPELPRLEPGDVFDKPDKLLGGINDILQRQIAPLRADLEATKRAAAYNQMKATARQMYPNFVPVFNQIEGAIDVYMANKELTEANFVAAIESAYGRAVLTNSIVLPNNTPAPTQNPPTTTAVPPTNVPAHLRPSNAAPASAPNAPKLLSLDDFDENERRLMREQKMTPEEYVELRDADPRDLVRIHKKLYGGKK